MSETTLKDNKLSAFEDFYNHCANHPYIFHLSELMADLDVGVPAEQLTELGERFYSNPIEKDRSDFLQLFYWKKTAFEEEMGRNKINIDDPLQRKDFYEHIESQLHRLINFYQFRFHLDYLEEIVDYVRNTDGGRLVNVILSHIDEIFATIKKFRGDVHDRVSLVQGVPDTNRDSENVEYIIDIRLVLKLYAAYDNRWWQSITHEKFISCFVKDKEPLVNLFSLLKEKLKFGFLLCCFEVNGQHTVEVDSKNHKGLIDSKLALKHFNIQEKAFSNFKSDGKKQFKDDKKFKDELEFILNGTERNLKSRSNRLL